MSFEGFLSFLWFAIGTLIGIITLIIAVTSMVIIIGDWLHARSITKKK